MFPAGEPAPHRLVDLALDRGPIVRFPAAPTNGTGVAVVGLHRPTELIGPRSSQRIIDDVRVIALRIVDLMNPEFAPHQQGVVEDVGAPREAFEGDLFLIDGMEFVALVVPKTLPMFGPDSIEPGRGDDGDNNRRRLRRVRRGHRPASEREEGTAESAEETARTDGANAEPDHFLGRQRYQNA